MQEQRTSFLAGSSVQKRVSPFGILVTCVLVGTGAASAADMKLVIATNGSGAVASDLHITFTGAGPNHTVSGISVTPAAAPGCSAPVVTLTENVVNIDWDGAACVPVGAQVSFTVTTPTGPLGLAAHRDWTFPDGAAPVRIPDEDIKIGPQAMDVTCQDELIGTLTIDKYQVDPAFVGNAAKGGIIMDATFALAANPGNKCWCEDVRWINFMVDYSQVANFAAVCPMLPYVDPHIVNTFLNCPVALQDDALPWFWTNAELPDWVAGNQPFADWTETPGVFTFKFHDKPMTGLLPNTVRFVTALVCVHSPTEIAVLKSWEWGFEVAANGVTTLVPAIVNFAPPGVNRVNALTNSCFNNPPTCPMPLASTVVYRFVTQQETLHHFNTTHILVLNLLADTGPADTTEIGPGPFDFNVLPAGTEEGGMTSDDVPPGLSIDSDTGAISGTPTVVGVSRVLCEVIEESSGEVVALLWWEIIIVPHFTLTLNFELDVFGDSGPVDTVGLGIGAGPFIYEPVPAGVELDGMISQDLPDGLFLDPDTGAISGTATVAETRHVLCILKNPETGEPWDLLWWKIEIVHPVWDFVWSEGEVHWGPGVWTKDGAEIGRTFPDGVWTGGTEPAHKSDHIFLPDWPNDWHWGVDFEWNGQPTSIMVWFENFDETTQIWIEIFCSPGFPQYSLKADIGNDTYTLTDAGGKPFHTGNWSGYPDNLPMGFEPTGNQRHNSEPPQVCGNDQREGTEECDGADDVLCSGLCQEGCTCPAPICGNGIPEVGEECDLGVNNGQFECIPDDCDCTADCKLPLDIVPTVSEWGLVVMLLIVLTSGTVMIGRKRVAAA